jgi:Flp pilus assembly pilin Flp
MMDHVYALYARVTLAALSLRNEERGQGMVEYSLVLVLVAMGCVLAFTGLATRIGSALSGVTF